MSPSTVWAQNYAAVNGVVFYTTDGDCGNPSAPCNLSGAVEDATDAGGSGNTIFVKLPLSGATVTFEEDLEGAALLDATVTLDTYLDDGGPTTGIQGFVQIDGDVAIDAGVVLTLVGNVELRLVGQPGKLEMRDNAGVEGDGVLVFGGGSSPALLLLGESTVDCADLPTPNTARVNNMRVDKTSGEAMVLDECDSDDESDLIITNRLDVVNGQLDMGDNNLHTESLSEMSGGSDPGVEIAAGAEITGSGTFFIAVEPAATGFPNTPDDCFDIGGAGNLNMAFDKVTDAGVCIDLNEIGAGGFSFNRAGTLFVREALILNGSFLNESLVGGVPGKGARTEFWTLETITTNLEVVGPGEEVDPSGSSFTNGTCETGDLDVGNESGVYFFAGVEIQGDLVTAETDDAGTAPCVEGVWFMGDEDPADPAALAKSAGPSDHQTHSTVDGDFTSQGIVGVYLDKDHGTGSFYHNVAFQGDFIFGSPSPIFTLVDPADAFPVGDLCGPYNVEADGNKVLFTGGADQLLKYPDDLYISSVQIKKNSTGQDVEVDNDPPDTGGTFIIDTSLEILRGTFITNGLLDAESTATVVVNHDAGGNGALVAGASLRAYVSDDADDVPRKVKYTGNLPHFSGSEIPGDNDGSQTGAEVFLPELEVFMSTINAVVTTGKDFTIGPDSKTGGKLSVTRGVFDVGTSIIRLANTLAVEIGDGYTTVPTQAGSRGEFDFPTEWIPNPVPDGFDRAFRVGEDGIDLLYFGTTDRTAGPEWPASDTDVANRYEDADAVRDVTINPVCADDVTISLRNDDNEYRLNGDLIIGAEGPGQSGAPGADVGALDIMGRILEVHASHNAGEAFNNAVVEVHNGADLCDSTDTLGGNPPTCDQPDAANARMGELVAAASAAMAEYRRTLSKEAAAEMQVHLAALQAARQELAKTAEHAGLLRFIGGDRTDVWVGTSAGRLRFDFPAIEVDKNGVNSGDDSRVTFDAEGVCSTTTGGLPPNRPDVIGTSHFTLINAEIGSDNCPDSGCGDAGGVELLDGLDVLDVRGQYEQYDGEFLMAGVSSVCPPPVNSYSQKVMVGFELEPGNMIIEDGEFYAGNPGGAGAGGDVEVFGDFCLGCTPPATSGAASKLAAEPSSGVFSLAVSGTHTVVGDFTVGPDTDPTSQDAEKRNRYFLGGECAILPDKGGLFANGNYHFEGTGDRFDDLSFLQQQQGLHGNVFFTGSGGQTVWHRQDEDAFFCDVIMASRSDDNTGILLLSNGWQNDEGTLTLEHGIIDTDEGQWDWIIQNTGFETDLAGRNNSARGTGVVDLGSRDSYVNGEVARRVESGNATGGIITGGYLFPVGTQENGADVFRALILQFPDDLGLSSLARVTYRHDLTNADVDFTPFVVPGSEGPLQLNGVGNLFWQLAFDRLPSFDPNVRVEADKLPNVFNILKLRILQWDCDGTNPRLAGFFDLSGGDPGSAAVTAFILGVPNVTQVGLKVQACQLFGIATDLAANPIINVTRYVATTGSNTGNTCIDPLNPCATLTYAVIVAYDGYTIDLAAGTYHESGLVIRKNLFIRGAGVVVQ